MKFASIIYNLFMILPQCSGVFPCCSDGSCCGTSQCGTVLPPGEPIDDDIIFLFIAALVYGLYVIKKMKSKLN